MRELGPTLDTFAMMPPTRLTELHMDPPEPVPALTAHQLLTPLVPSVLDQLLAVAGPGSDSPWYPSSCGTPVGRSGVPSHTTAR